ncbi:MAG: hypothetical protein ACRD24_16235 [Terriglobales bacterium]
MPARASSKGAEAARGDVLLDRKYGWQRKLGNLWRRIVPKKRTVVAIELDAGQAP